MQAATRQRLVELVEPGLVRYRQGFALQEELFEDLISDKRLSLSHQAEARDYIICCQHYPVFTLGKSGKEDNLLVSHEELDRRGIDFVRTTRGGDITFHGPGQLVVYPIFDLDFYFTDIHRYLRTLEEAVILTLADFSIVGSRIDGLTGVWVGERKICAMGVRASRWVVMHGLALNISPDLSYFALIVPCNIPDKEVTSMERELGLAPSLQEVQARLLHHMSALFGFAWVAAVANPA